MTPKFYETLAQVLNQINLKKEIFMLGDFNTLTGCCTNRNDSRKIWRRSPQFKDFKWIFPPKNITLTYMESTKTKINKYHKLRNPTTKILH